MAYSGKASRFRAKRRSAAGSVATVLAAVLFMAAALTFLFGRDLWPAKGSAAPQSSALSHASHASHASYASSAAESSAVSEAESGAAGSEGSRSESSSINIKPVAGLVDPALTAEQIRTFLDSPELRLVNRDHTLGKDYEPELSDVTKYSSSGGQRRIASACHDALCAFIDASRAAGHKTYLVSGYRSYALQKRNYDSNVQSYIKKGYSAAEAAAIVQRTIMPPGASEHQYGYAADIASSSTLNTGLDKTEAYKWLAGHAAQYGFILRYPKGKEAVTGVSYEPWHFRYVGQYHADIIMKNNVCLEEYIYALQARLNELA